MITVPVKQQFNESHNMIMEARETLDTQILSFLRTAYDASFKLMVNK
jgi:hypothetical protein